jgi:alkylhydroperoxidase/carboxymuconolactone decarboxylase family protein YurZ
MPSKSSRKPASRPRLPGTFKEFITEYPELGAAHERVASAVEKAGPLDGRTLALVKIGICLGAGLESALRSHVRRALEHGAARAEIEQAILLGMNTVGFPRTVAAWAWARAVDRDRPLHEPRAGRGRD